MYFRKRVALTPDAGSTDNSIVFLLLSTPKVSPVLRLYVSVESLRMSRRSMDETFGVESNIKACV